jgi:hypothetical protein
MKPDQKFHDGKAFKSVEEFMDLQGVMHEIKLDDGQRQMILTAMALLAIKRPGWQHALSDIALLMDNPLPDGRPQIFSEMQKFNRGPIQLKWEYQVENYTWFASVPAIDHHGKGFLNIHAMMRPEYCDRGKWHVLIEPVGVAGPDNQEGFPRYYFSLANLKDEMEAWVNNRNKCRRAFSESQTQP